MDPTTSEVIIMESRSGVRAAPGTGDRIDEASPEDTPTRSDRTWTGVQESLRRERRMHDLLARSGSTRLHLRVTSPVGDRPRWRASERVIVHAEREIRMLDPAAPGFWGEFQLRRENLIAAFSAAGTTFEG